MPTASSKPLQKSFGEVRGRSLHVAFLRDKEFVLAFESYHFGLTKIEGLDDVGRIRWRVVDARSDVANNSKKRFN